MCCLTIVGGNLCTLIDDLESSIRVWTTGVDQVSCISAHGSRSPSCPVVSVSIEASRQIFRRRSTLVTDFGIGACGESIWPNTTTGFLHANVHTMMGDVPLADAEGLFGSAF